MLSSNRCLETSVLATELFDQRLEIGMKPRRTTTGSLESSHTGSEYDEEKYPNKEANYAFSSWVHTLARALTLPAN